jgi:hypothetical protein
VQVDSGGPIPYWFIPSTIQCGAIGGVLVDARFAIESDTPPSICRGPRYIEEFVDYRFSPFSNPLLCIDGAAPYALISLAPCDSSSTSQLFVPSSYGDPTGRSRLRLQLIYFNYLALDVWYSRVGTATEGAEVGVSV